MLLSLVVLWIGLLIWQFDHSSEQARAPLTHISGQRTTGKAPASAVGGDLQVHLERLAAIKGQRESTFATPRNIFASLLPQVEPVSIPSASSRRGRSRGPAKPAAPPAEQALEEPQSEVTAEEAPVEEGPKGPTPEEIERLRIATELNQFRYVVDVYRRLPVLFQTFNPPISGRKFGRFRLDNYIFLVEVYAPFCCRKLTYPPLNP